MRIAAISGLLLLASIAMWAGNQRQPLHVKLGLWEVTKIATASDELPIPAALLEKLSPEQRARLEERLNAQSTETAKKTVTKYCLTAQQLKGGIPFDQEHKSCQQTVVRSSAARIEIRTRCTDKERASHGILEIEALSAENVKGTVQSLPGGGRGANSSFTAKWISSSCAAK